MLRTKIKVDSTPPTPRRAVAPEEQRTSATPAAEDPEDIQRIVTAYMTRVGRCHDDFVIDNVFSFVRN